MNKSSEYVVGSSLKSSREKARKKFGLYAQTLSSRVGDKWVTQLLPHNDPIHYGFSIGGAEFKTTPNRTLEKAKKALNKSKSKNNNNADIDNSNNTVKVYQDNDWHTVDSMPDDYYVWMNKDGVSYCREKAEYDGNGNPFLNRSLNDPKFEVEK